MLYKQLLLYAILLATLGTGCKPTPSTTAVHPDLESELLDAGDEIAAATFTALSGELKAAMAEGGVPHAIDYCHLRASPITDSLAQHYQVAIKRTSLRYRNPGNAPTTREKRVLNDYQKSHDARQVLKHIVEASDSTYHYYSPIMMQPLCLNCHGAPATIPAYRVIKDRYPGDLATDYAVGDLRGMWSITLLP